MRELERLRDELDLAYAAASELDVEAARLVRVLPVDLLLRQPHVRECLLDRARVRIDARAHARSKARVERDRAGRRARPNQRLQFPRLRRLAIVAQRFCERDAQRAVAPVW